MSGAVEVRDNRAAKRFEAALDGYAGRVEYNLIEGGMVISHTEVDPALEGRGVASRMFAKVLETARAEHLRLIPVCPLFAAWVKRHPESHDLIDPGFRRSLGLPLA